MDSLRELGLSLQLRGEHGAALAAYDRVLSRQANDWNVAHMRAVAFYQAGLIDRASEAFAALLDTPARELPGFWTNLSLAVGLANGDPLDPALRARAADYRQWQRERRACAQAARANGAVAATPLDVSVVIPAYNHRRFVADALASVFTQSVLPRELIVIDDGSADGTARELEAAMSHAPIPVTLISRGNRGAAPTLNEAIAMARGRFIQPLNSDDRLLPGRLQSMWDEVALAGARWGCGRVRWIDAEGAAVGLQHSRRATALQASQDGAMAAPSLGLALLRANFTISTGNLFFEKSLWESLGGFRDYRYNHDWDFCLRAALLSEPMLARAESYEYRMHETNAITESSTAPREELGRVFADFLHEMLGGAVSANPFAPTFQRWGRSWLSALAAGDALQQLARPALLGALRPDAIAFRPADGPVPLIGACA